MPKPLKEGFCTKQFQMPLYFFTFSVASTYIANRRLKVVIADILSDTKSTHKKRVWV